MLAGYICAGSFKEKSMKSVMTESKLRIVPYALSDKNTAEKLHAFFFKAFHNPAAVKLQISEIANIILKG
jgi:hypothetical protein